MTALDDKGQSSLREEGSECKEVPLGKSPSLGFAIMQPWDAQFTQVQKQERDYLQNPIEDG